MTRIIVPARQGRAVELSRGQRLRVITPQGNQAVDFFAFAAGNMSEWLSVPHTWSGTFRMRLSEGDDLLSCFRRPLLRFAEDGANGLHDLTFSACDQFRYEQFGHHAPHANCADNLGTALRRLGLAAPLVPHPINFFTSSRIEPDGRIVSPSIDIPPGAFVELEALSDVIAVACACPFDVWLDGWTVQDKPPVPSEIVLEVD
ncbi:MAG: urea carboxylase-associated family protein [Hyphomicrobiaceae bacterium]